MQHRRGIILMIVLWILLLTGFIALGLGRVGGGEMSLLKISLGRCRAYAAARSGIEIAEQRLIRFPPASEVVMPQTEDTRKAYAAVPVGAGAHFDVGFKTVTLNGPALNMTWGPVDEAGRFNINMIDGSGVEAETLKALVESVAPGAGEGFVRGVLAFRSGPERRGVTRPFYVLEELLFVEGVGPKLFQQLRDMLTVYPYIKRSAFRVNIFAASPLLAKAVFRAGAALAGVDAGTAVRDVEDFLKCRTRSAGAIGECALPTYLCVLSQLDPVSGRMYRIRSTGVDEASKVKVAIEEVVDIAGDGSKVSERIYWRRD